MARTNLIPSPRAALEGAPSWGALADPAGTWQTTLAEVTTPEGVMTATRVELTAGDVVSGGIAMVPAAAERPAVAPGQVLRVGVRVWATIPGLALTIGWLDAAGELIHWDALVATAAAAVVSGPGTWLEVEVPVPADAVRAHPVLRAEGGWEPGAWVQATAGIATLDAPAAPWFDGDSPAARIGGTARALLRSWSGVAHASTSVEEEGPLPIETITAVVPVGQAPVIQVIIPPGVAPAGRTVEVTGHAGDFSWPVRAGARLADGQQILLGDAMAPVNTTIVYRLVDAGGVVLAASEPVIRPWGGLSLLSDTLGGHKVSVLWQGDDEREIPQRVNLHTIAGRRTPVAVMDPVMGAGTVSLTARTGLVDTKAMAELVGAARVVALFHNPARCWQCRRGACDVPLVTVMALTSVSHRRTARTDEAERSWALKGTLVSVPEPRTPLAVSVWNDFDQVAFTWDQVDALGWSWDRFDRTLWQEVSP